MPLQPRLPILPPDAQQISPALALSREGGRLTFFNAAGPIYTCEQDDRLGLRVAAAVLCDPRVSLVKPKPLAEVLGIHRSSIFLYRKRHEREGVSGLEERKRGPRGPHKFKGEVLARARRYLDQGLSNSQVGQRVGVTEGTIRYALRQGRLKRPERSEVLGEELSRPSARSEKDRSGERGVAVKRHADRALARTGELAEAKPEFVPAEAVAGAGVLVALPAVMGQGLFEVAGKVYGALKNGYFGLDSMLLTFMFMALLRLRTIENLASHAPGEFGLLLGLDRAPEMKTARRKLKELGLRGLASEFAGEFARRWAEEAPEALGYLYVDGHVRPYNGRKHKLPKTHVQRRRLCMPATTDYWVNDAKAEPLFFVTAEANDGLLRMMEEKLLPEIRELAGPERRVTMIFDREGWSPKRFEKWAKEGFEVLTYRKGKYAPWPEEDFKEVEGKVAGREVSYKLAERRVEVSKEFWMREVRRLCDDGHQTSVVTTHPDMTTLEVAQRMFSRWQQENFFRYMRHEFDLDHIPTTAVEAADPERLVRNPARKAKEKELASVRVELARAEREYGEEAFDNLEAKRRTMRGFKIAHARLGERVRQLRERCAELEGEVQALPERVPIRELMKPEEIVRLERERKVLTDTLKMVAYRAETQLANLVGPLLRTHQDEARKFLRDVFHLPGDLVPDAKKNRLVVRLHGMATERSNRALRGLCEVLNEQKIRYPGTRLRLVLELCEVLNEQKIRYPGTRLRLVLEAP